MAHRDTLSTMAFNRRRSTYPGREDVVSKRGRKKRSRKKNAANHGKRPNT
jgi:hypothetical protein